MGRLQLVQSSSRINNVIRAACWGK